MKTTSPTAVKNLIRVRKDNSDTQNDDSDHYFLYPQKNEYIGESIIKSITSKWNSWFHSNSSTTEAPTTTKLMEHQELANKTNCINQTKSVSNSSGD